MKLFIFSIFFILITNFGFTQDSTSLQLKELTVNEKRKVAIERGEFMLHAQSLEAFTEEELNRNNPSFIEQSLGTMAGVQVDKRTQLGGQRIVIRGYGNDQKFNSWGIKAYLNGVPITTADGVTIFDDLDFALVSHIEVVKGPAATLYGGGVGGVVKFSMKPSDLTGIRFSEKISVGSFGLIQSHNRLNVVNENTSMYLSYGHLRSDGYRPRGNSLKNYLTYNGKFNLSKNQTLTAYLSHNYSEEGVTGQISYADYYAGIDNGNAAYAQKNARNEILASRFSLNYQYLYSDKFSNNTSVFFANQDFKRVAAGADEISMNPNFGIRSVFNFHYNFTKKIINELFFGTEIQQSRSLISNYRFLGTDDANPLKVQDISKGSFFKYISNQNSFFAHNRTNISQLGLSMIFGLSINNINYNRIDLLAPLGLITNYNKDLSFSKTFSTSYNPHIALQKTIKKHIINISYSEGFNAPTASTAFIATINKANDDLLPEKAKMIDLSIQGLMFNNKLDYQLSLFSIDIKNKLTQLSGAINGSTYGYWANTGHQKNSGLELSLGYLLVDVSNSKVFKRIEPFFNASLYSFKYQQFSTNVGTKLLDFSGKMVIGVPTVKYTVGLDFLLNSGLYCNNTFSYMGGVYTDFANTNFVKSFGMLNSKIGYRCNFKKIDMDIYMAGNNLTNQINYTFLFLGNNMNDTNPGNIQTTDVNPGPSKAYWFGGVNLTYKIK